MGKWRTVTFIAVPLCTAFAAHTLMKEHKHGEKGPAYPYLHIRSKGWPWGTLFVLKVLMFLIDVSHDMMICVTFRWRLRPVLVCPPPRTLERKRRSSSLSRFEDNKQDQVHIYIFSFISSTSSIFLDVAINVVRKP